MVIWRESVPEKLEAATAAEDAIQSTSISNGNE